MSAFVLAQVTRVGAGEVAEAAFVRFLALVQGADVRLKLRVCGGCVAAAIAHVRSLSGMGTLMVVFGLVGGECLVAAVVATGVRTVACVAEEMA